MGQVPSAPKEEIKEEPHPFAGKIVSIEGNIGVGKTTLGRSLVSVLEREGLEVIFHDEPVNQQMLKQFLIDPKKYAYPFQLYMLTRRQVNYVKAQQAVSEGKCVIIDRSLAGDFVFATLQHQLGNITTEDYTIYQQVYKDFEEFVPDYILYLQASVKSIKERIKRRNRDGEDVYDDDYLTKLDETYRNIIHEHHNEPPTKIVYVSWETEREVTDGLLATKECVEILDALENSSDEGEPENKENPGNIETAENKDNSPNNE
jgi:deoxyadenosine/deoxycytidine kinase